MSFKEFIAMTAFVAGLAALPVAAQQTDHDPSMKMTHDNEQPIATEGGLTEPGQSAFAVIAEVVSTLEADPATDWSEVDIDALWAHLKDMDQVFTNASATTVERGDGVIFTVTGSGVTIASIQRMVAAHSNVMEGVNGWHYAQQPTPEGAEMTLTAPAADLAQIKALGFAGILASGMHHQVHHWMIATGMNPHT